MADGPTELSSYPSWHAQVNEPDVSVQSPFAAQLCVFSAVEAGSYLRLIDSCITQLKAQGAARTCNESKEEEEVFCSRIRSRR